MDYKPYIRGRVDADIELIVSGKDGKINMIEAGAKKRLMTTLRKGLRERRKK